MTELVLATPLSDEQRHWLDTVKAASESLLVVIDDVLDFSKIRAGKLELELTPFSLRGELDAVLRILSLRAHGKGIELLGNVALDVPDEVVGDCVRVRQVLVNLVANAIKFTDEGEIVVKVSVAERAVAGRNVAVRFEVSDTGIGIPRAKQAAIFEPFVQEDPSTARKYGGTGLGLAIAAQLVALMGGDIGVVSEPERGSTFTFTVAFGQDPSPPALVSALPRMSTARAAMESGVGPSVLVAEDNEFNVELLERMLEEHGSRTVVARAGDDALRQALSGRFDVLLLDLHLPGLDGFEVLAKLRAEETGRHLPVIALTAGAREDDRERCFAAGADEFLVKPLRSSALWRAIVRLCESDARNAPEPAALAAEALLSACEGNEALMDTIWQGLATHLPSELENLEAALERSDARAVFQLAHRLQGMLAAVSPAAEAVAAELEDLARAGALAEAGPPTRRLRQLIRGVLRRGDERRAPG
jgi:CheY-like chemotaxis protein